MELDSVVFPESERNPGCMKSSKPRVGRASKRTASSPIRPALPKTTLKIPPILLEGDEPGSPPITGPGQKYSLGASPTLERAVSQQRELPEAYGTARLLLLARDPHSLYAQWDLTSAQQRQYNSLAADGHLVLRVHQDQPAGFDMFELHVLPESRHWFIAVPGGGATYLAELGCYTTTREWISVAASGRVTTPPATVSPDKSVRFATMPAGSTRSRVLQALETIPAQGIPAESCPTLLPPPRVSWLPGLGVEPSDFANQGPESGSVLTYDSAQSHLSAPIALLSEAWTLEQELELNKILGLAMVAGPVMSSLQFAQAARPEDGLETVSSQVSGQ